MLKDRTTKRQPPKTKMFVAIAIIVFGLVAFGFSQEYLKNKDIELDIARMKVENAALDAKKLSSLLLIDTLSSSYYVEGEARKSGLGKDGERLIIVQDDYSNLTIVTPIISHDDVPNPLRWYNFFFDHDAYQALQPV